MSSKRSHWPPAKKDLSGTRLAKALEDSKERQAAMQKIDPALGLDLSPVFKSSFGRGGLFDALLRIDKTKDKDAAMAKAFDAAGLNPDNPLHWYELLSILCSVHFGPQERGRKKEWEGEAYHTLFTRSQKIAKEQNLSDDVKIAKELKKLYPKDYAKQRIDALRKLLPKARAFYRDIFIGQNPGHVFLNMFIRDRAQEGKGVTPFERDIITHFEAQLLDPKGK